MDLGFLEWWGSISTNTREAYVKTFMPHTLNTPFNYLALVLYYICSSKTLQQVQNLDQAAPQCYVEIHSTLPCHGWSSISPQEVSLSRALHSLPYKYSWTLCQLLLNYCVYSSFQKCFHSTCTLHYLRLHR